MRDGETVKVGPIGITAHLTPGHTPGSTTWSWTSCENQRCMNVVYADSLNPISRDGFHFTGKGESPDISAAFAASIAKVAALKCDIVLSAHPDATDTLAKAAARTAGAQSLHRRRWLQRLCAGPPSCSPSASRANAASTDRVRSAVPRACPAPG